MSKVIKILAGLFVVIMILVVVIISTIDVNEYKTDLVQLVEEATGRKLVIDGEIGFAISLIPTVVIEDVKFANASWGSKPDMLSLDKFEVQVSLIPLLSGNIQVNRVILLAPEILLETDKQGAGNWIFKTAVADKKSATDNQSESITTADSKLPGIVINEVQIENARVTYKDGVTGKETKLVVDKLVTESNSFDEPFSLFANIIYDEIPVQIEGTMGALDQLVANDKYPLNIKISVSEASIELQGDIAKPLAGKGLELALSFNIASLSKLSKLAGNELPGIGPVSLNGTLSDGDNSYSLKSVKMQAGKTDLSGDLTVNLSGKRPALSAILNADMIDLFELSGGDAKPAKKTKNARVFSSDPLPLESMQSLNAEITITAKQIQTSSLVLKDTKTGLTLKNGNLIIKPLTALVAGGRMQGFFGLDASGKAAVLDTDISIKGLEPSQLPDLDAKVTGAKTDVSIKVKGSGNSVSNIMAGLNGKFLVKVGKGVIKDTGSNIASADILTKSFSMLTPSTTSDDSAQLECGVANFDIKDGIATTNKGIALATNKMNVIGSGTIDLKTEKLSIGISPEAREGVGISVGQLAELVKLGGTLANPKPETDTKAAFKAGVSVGAAVATGGLSILAQGLFDRATADADPCTTALGEKPVKPKTTSKQAETTTSNKSVETTQGTEKSMTDKIRGFFE